MGLVGLVRSVLDYIIMLGNLVVWGVLGCLGGGYYYVSRFDRVRLDNPCLGQLFGLA